MAHMILERSPDTDAAIEVLRGVNDEISYAELAKRSKLTVKRLKQVLGSARRILDKELIGFGCIRGIGLKRLAPTDKANLTVDVLDRIGRASGRGMKRTELNDVDYNGMEKSAQHIHTGNRTIINLVKAQTKAKAQPPKSSPQPSALPLPDVESLVRMRDM